MKKLKLESPEYILTFAIFVVAFGLMIQACICRLLGIDWFVADLNIVVPNTVIQKILMAMLKVFEGVFILKFILRSSWHKSFFISLLMVCIGGYFSNVFGIIFDYLSIGFVSLLFVSPKREAARRFLISSGTLFLYGVICFFARAELNQYAKYNYNIMVVLSIDYTLIPVNMYLFDSLRRCKK